MSQFVSQYFGSPEGLIGLGNMAASATSVPEASIDKDCEIRSGKEKIRFTW